MSGEEHINGNEENAINELHAQLLQKFDPIIDEILEIFNRHDLSTFEAYGLLEVLRDIVFWNTDKAQALIHTTINAGIGAIMALRHNEEGKHEGEKDNADREK